MRMSPPWPPSPPEGPPLGTNFSRRKAMQPLPPSPAFNRILASSINIALLKCNRWREIPRFSGREWFKRGHFGAFRRQGNGVARIEQGFDPARFAVSTGLQRNTLQIAKK